MLELEHLGCDTVVSAVLDELKWFRGELQITTSYSGIGVVITLLISRVLSSGAFDLILEVSIQICRWSQFFFDGNVGVFGHRHCF